MRILALDQASRTSGYSVFIDNKLETFGKFTFEDADIGIRLNKIRDKVAELIEQYNIDFVAFEDIQLQNNVSNNVATFKVLSEVFGVVYELITDLNIEHEIVHSETWKSKLKISGKTRPEQKKNAQIFVTETYNVKATQDESDAICIGTYIVKTKQEEIFFDWSD